jgi:hypothetical protein
MNQSKLEFKEAGPVSKTMAATITFEQCAKKAMECRKDIQPRTARVYWRSMRKYICPTIGQVRMRNINPLHVKVAFEKLEKSGLAPSTARNVRTMVYSVFRYAVLVGICESNPASGVTPFYRGRGLIGWGGINRPQDKQRPAPQQKSGPQRERMRVPASFFGGKEGERVEVEVEKTKPALTICLFMLLASLLLNVFQFMFYYF